MANVEVGEVSSEVEGVNGEVVGVNYNSKEMVGVENSKEAEVVVNLEVEVVVIGHNKWEVAEKI